MPKRKKSDKKTSGAKLLTRRGLILLGGQASFVGLLAWRLHYLQVNQSEQYRLLAEENRINIRLLAPARGLILDRNGTIIAENPQNYRVVIVRERAGDVPTILERLATIIPLSDEDRARALKEIERRAAFVPVAVASNLSWSEISAVSANAPALPGVIPEMGNSRFYPRGPDFAHIVGYVGAVSESDLRRVEDQDPLLQIPKFQIGKRGVEDKIDRKLRGLAGARRIEVNAVGRVMREIDRQEGVAGKDAQLTIDADLQNFTMARLDGESAAAVVMDVNTGDLLAMGSTPSFDPNLFVDGISRDDYKLLTDDTYKPLLNKAVQGNYPPGSTFKMMVALAALEEGVIDTVEEIFCRGYIEVGNQRFHCWKRSGHGNMNMKNSLKNSCDVYYYGIAQRVGIEKIAAMARRFGLGEHANLPISSISPGLIPDKAWKKKRFKQDWRIGDTVNSGIGQGFVLATPLQLAVMAGRLGSGRSIEPRLIKALGGKKIPLVPSEPLGVSSSSLKAVRGGMIAVSNERGGTAYSSRIAAEDLGMAGKTGTSQVRRITMEDRRQGLKKDSEIAWENRDHALYVAFAPYDKPRYSIAVVVEHGGGGSKVAAPIARDIMLQALYGGMPPLTAYPKSQRTRIKNQRDKLVLREGARAPGKGIDT